MLLQHLRYSITCFFFYFCNLSLLTLYQFVILPSTSLSLLRGLLEPSETIRGHWRSMRSPFLSAVEAPTTRRVSEWWEKLVCYTVHTYIHGLPTLKSSVCICKQLLICLLRSLSGKTTGIPIHVFGTETHMTAIVGMALGHRPIPNQPPVAVHTANFLLNSSGSTSVWHILAPRRQIGHHRVTSRRCTFAWSKPPTVWCRVSRRLRCHSLSLSVITVLSF